MAFELISAIDGAVSQGVLSLRSPVVTKVMVFFTTIGSPQVMVFFTVALLVVLMFKKRTCDAVVVAISMAGGLVSELGVKQLVQRARPENGLVHASGFSFPSGHATMSLIFFSLLIWVFKDEIENTVWRRMFIAANILFFALIGLSRVYLGVHWASDVVAGFGLGLCWVFLTSVCVRMRGSKKSRHVRR